MSPVLLLSLAHQSGRTVVHLNLLKLVVPVVNSVVGEVGGGAV